MHWEGLHLLSRAMCLGYTIFFFFKGNSAFERNLFKDESPVTSGP